MSSFEEENLYQMVDDFLDLEASGPQALLQVSSHSPSISDHNTEYYILQETLESWTNVEVDVLRRVVKYVREKLVDVEECTSMKKSWLVKCLKKDGYNASLCHTHWPTTLSCPGGEHEFIEILQSEGKRLECAKSVIVDIDFKSQFELARPTSHYKELCDMLPSVFVGDEQKLNKIISILCSEAKNSFRERGLHVPPWRTPCYMASKWNLLSQKLPSQSSRRQAMCAEINRPAKAGHIVVSSSSNSVTPRRKYLGVDQCGLSSQFSAMSTKCS
jgi:uncharacterized protein (TIGR01615 family)